MKITESELIKLIKESIIKEYNRRNYDIDTLPYRVKVKDNKGNVITATLGSGRENGNVKYVQKVIDLSGSYTYTPNHNGIILSDSKGQAGRYYFDNINNNRSRNYSQNKRNGEQRHWWDKDERNRKFRMNGHPIFGDYYDKDGHPLDPNTGKWSETNNKFNYLYDNGKYKLKNMYYHTLRDPINGIRNIPKNFKKGNNFGQRLANGLTKQNFLGFNIPQHSYGVK